MTEATFSFAEITKNEFRDNSNTVDPAERSGLRWRNTQMGNPLGRALISENNFYDDAKTSPDPGSFKFQSYGAWISGSSKVRLEDNYFYQNYQTDIAHEYKGTWLFGAPSNEIINNNFIGNFGPATVSATSTHRYHGIYSYNSGHNLISCNNSQSLNHGFYFEGPSCDHTVLQYNIMSDNLTGLYLSPGSIIGLQEERENWWTGSLPANGVAEAHFDGNPGLGSLLMSLFEINDLNQNSPLWANPRNPANNWFTFSGNDPDLQSYRCVKELDPEEEDESSANKMAVEGTFEAYKGYPASLWEAELDAFGVLAAHPELRTTSSPEEEFYDMHDTDNLGKLHRAKDAWSNIAVFTTSFETTWNGNQIDIDEKLEEIREQNQLMQDAETGTEQQQIAQTLATLYSELNTLQQTNQSLSGQYKSDMADRADQLATDLDNISTTEVWEQNLKTVLDLSVEKLLSGNADWTTTQYDALKAIADQCRHEGGIGVVMARTAVELFEYDLVQGNREAVPPFK